MITYKLTIVRVSISNQSNLDSKLGYLEPGIVSISVSSNLAPAVTFSGKPEVKIHILI